MAHFAKINENNIVEQIIVIDNKYEKTADKFIKEVLKLEGKWIQTSYNASIRGKFAGVNDVYDPENDIFYQIPNPLNANETLD